MGYGLFSKVSVYGRFLRPAQFSSKLLNPQVRVVTKELFTDYGYIKSIFKNPVSVLILLSRSLIKDKILVKP